jgi:hypothetical protein
MLEHVKTCALSPQQGPRNESQHPIGPGGGREGLLVLVGVMRVGRGL